MARAISERVSVRGGAACGDGKVDQHKIGNAWGRGQPKFADLLRQPGQPPRIMSSRGLSMRDIGYGCDPGRDRGLTDIEGPANTVEGIDYVGRPIEPAYGAPNCSGAPDCPREYNAR
jgi:hypothetical protein